MRRRRGEGRSGEEMEHARNSGFDGECERGVRTRANVYARPCGSAMQTTLATDSAGARAKIKIEVAAQTSTSRRDSFAESLCPEK
eukprot:6210425-Pleurochrysis_carterae.AAC.2